MSYEVRFTSRFKKDLKLAQKQGKNIDKLFAVVETLASGKPLAPSYRDHDLWGDYTGCRKCHIEPDWLLIYEINHGLLILMLNRIGSHSDLFKEPLIKSGVQIALSDFSSVAPKATANPWWICEDFWHK